ncbi:MAG: hypothetical protein ACTSRS_18060 [Candidatus Helarchaeota archaeon]
MERITELISNFEALMRKEVKIESLEKLQADLATLDKVMKELAEKTKAAITSDSEGAIISFEAYFKNISEEVNQIQTKFSNLINLTKQMETDTAIKQFLLTKINTIFDNILNQGSRNFNLSTYEIFKEFLQEIKSTMEEDLMERVEKELFSIKTGLGEFEKVYEVAGQQFSGIQKYLEDMKQRYQNQFESIRLKTELIEQMFPTISQVFSTLNQDNTTLQNEVEHKLTILREAPVQLLNDLRVELDKYQKDVLIQQIQLQASKEALESDLEATSKKLQESEKVTEMSQQEIKKMQEEHAKMKAELEYLSKQLESVTKEFTTLSQEKDRQIEMREVVALVMTLLVEVFGAQPHSKLLFLLHGQKEEMDRSALIKASGIGGAIVRKALADLAAAKLVKYDVESGAVSLLKRIY